MKSTDTTNAMPANVSRRSFLRLSGLAALGLAPVALVGCGPADQGSTTDGDASAEQAGEAATELTSAGFGETGKLRIGMEAAYAPYNWQESSETDQTIPIDNVPGAYADGYDVQIGIRIAQDFGLEPVAVKLEWDGLIEALNNGQIDCIIAGMTATPEREQSIDFTDPYYVGTYGLMVQSGSPYENATSLEDFAGAAVLGQKDTLLDDVIDEIPDVNHLTPVETVPNQIAQLAQGTCDAITFDVGNAKGILKANPDLVAIVFDEGKGFSEEVPVNIGVKKGNEEVVETMNAALATVSEAVRQAIWDDVTERQPA